MEEAEKRGGGGVAESGGDTDIDQLLRARTEIDSALQRHKAEFTVLFTDIVGSTAFFEKFGDTAGLMMLQHHHDLVLPTIEKAGGTVVKTIGDAVLAIFTSPATAVRTAIRIQRDLDAYNEERPRADHIYTRVGLNFGSGFVKEKDVFGDVVNVAARIVKACAPAQILVSRRVYEAIQKTKGFICRPLGAAALHGKTAPEEIYEILWTSEESYLRVRRQLDSSAEPGKSTRNVVGRYEIMDELGRGAMGVVYKAYDPTVGRIVALKTVRLEVSGADREELIRRLRLEAQAAGRLEHSNIVTVYDAGEAEGLFYLAMQFVKGRLLAQMIAERTLLPVKQIVLLLEQVCDGLDYAHERGIIHRDLKPSNMIVTPEGTAKVLDFGVAKVAEVGTTKAGMVLGTPSYMSPEQAQGGRVDRRSDIFSLGAILYELLTGEKAFSGNTPTAVIYKIINEDPIPLRIVEPAVHPALAKIVGKALAKDPFRRYQTCHELKADLSAFRSGKLEAPLEAEAPKAPPPPRAVGVPPPAAPLEGAKRVVVKPPPPAEPAPASRAQTWVLLGSAVFLLVAGAGFWGWREGWFSAKPSTPDRSSPPAAVQPAPAQVPPTAQPTTESKPALTPAKPEPTSPPSAKTPAPKEAAPRPEARPGTSAPPEKSSVPAEPKRRPRPAAPPPPALSPEQQQQIESWFLQAEQYRQGGEYRQAIYALEQILRIDPNNTQAQESLKRVRRMLELKGETP